MVDNENDLKEIKVILLGESGVGKTCIINRYVHNLFSPEVESTLGSSFLCKEIIKDNIKYKLNIWDTTGQERYRSVTNIFIKGALIVILVYAIDSMNSFESLKYWYENVKEKLEGDKYILAIVGNKSDLIENEVVSEDEARSFATERNAIFATISCKQTPEGIDCLFNNLLDELIKKNYFQPSKSYVLNNKKKHNTEKKKKIC